MKVKVTYRWLILLILQLFSKAQSTTFLQCKFATNTLPKDDTGGVETAVFPCSGADFGHYGDISSTWTLIAYEKDACMSSKVERPPSPDDSDLLVRGRAAFIRRGGCSFAEKVLFLQRLGAAAVVIGDYPENDTAETSMMGSDEKLSPLITIPSFFVPGRATRFVLAGAELSINISGEIGEGPKRRPTTPWTPPPSIPS